MKMIVHVLLLVVFYLFMNAEAQATTTIGRGIVVEVGKTKDAKGTPIGGDVLTVRLTWSNYAGEGSVVNVPVPDDAVILLDGKLAKRGDAMKPGHLVKVLVDCNYFEFYSKTGQLTSDKPPADSADGCYTLTLEGAVNVTPILTALKQTGPGGKAPLVLHLDCRKDRIVGAAEVAKSNGSRIKGIGGGLLILACGAFHDVDASGLAVKNGKLTGEVKVRFHGSNRATYGSNEAPPPQIPADGVIATGAYVLDAAVGSDGAVSGTYRGAVEKTEIAGKLTGTARARPAAPEAYTVWLRPLPAPSQLKGAINMHGIRFLGFKVRDRAVKHDHMSGGHCERLGEVASGTASLEAGKLTAEAKLSVKGSANYTMKLECMLIGDCIFGTYRMTNETGLACEGRLRGELLAFDAPATEGWNEVAFRKEVARLKVERDAKRKAEPAAP